VRDFAAPLNATINGNKGLACEFHGANVGVDQREVGILCHLTSLPNKNGFHGRLGDDAFSFVDSLVDVGATVWQMLPITPPDSSGSPYASSSAFAAYPSLSDPASETKIPIGYRDSWINKNRHWAYDWAIFSLLKIKYDGAPWTEWPSEIRNRDPSHLQTLFTQKKSELEEIISDQVRFQLDWDQLRDYARGRGLRLFGDLPIFVAHDSADVWANRHLFKLRPDGFPSVITGVPPDAFSLAGQKWGTVHHNWLTQSADGFAWWRHRIKRLLEFFDLVRIDHFRAFDASWEIPYDSPDAQTGVWEIGPRDSLLSALIAAAGGPQHLVAEDLGIIPPSVIQLRRRHSLLGLAVLQFGFEGGLEDNPHSPSNIGDDVVVYTGTHDNDTTTGWGDQLTLEQRKNLSFEMVDGESVTSCLIRLALSSPSPLAIIPLQDIFGYGSEARMNTPGTVHGNWSWQATPSDMASLSEYRLRRAY